MRTIIIYHVRSTTGMDGRGGDITLASFYCLDNAIKYQNDMPWHEPYASTWIWEQKIVIQDLQDDEQ